MLKREEEEKPSSPVWLTTYGDMVTLILCFFVLLISYSSIESDKFQGAVESLKGSLGIFAGEGNEQYIKINEMLTAKKNDLFERIKIIEKLILRANLQGVVEVIGSNSGIQIRLGDQVLFDPGKAEIRKEAYAMLSSIAQVVKDDQKEIYVEGHTDNIPINTSKYPSNWELSAARAVSVVKFLNEVEGIPEKYLAAVGHGEHRPLVPNNTVENRKKNRRVEIFIKW